jgi:hypothetical protein
MAISRGKLKNLERHMLQCDFVYDEFHMKPPGIESGSPL